jgi:maleylacetoacetate isomerase
MLVPPTRRTSITVCHRVFEMQLYTRATSSCAFRVRIALNIKKLTCEHIPMVASEQRAESFLELNPQGLVPLLVNGSDRVSQSLAIMEYLDEVFPGSALLPADASGRARVRAISLFISSEIQPAQNTRMDPELKRWVRFHR